MVGEAVGDVKPKCSTVLAAANVVLDRAYPKASEDGAKGHISFTQINVNLAASPQDMVLSTVDVTPADSDINDNREL